MIVNDYSVDFIATVKVKINSEVFKEITDEWRGMFYDFEDENAVIEHIAYNLMMGRKLSQMDGFAHLPDEYAVLEDVDLET